MSNHNSNFRWALRRRDFLKTAVASGVALAVGGLGLTKLLYPQTSDSVSAASGTGPYYWGADTSWPRTDASKKLPRNFYIGRTGIGASPITNPAESSFSETAAAEVGTLYTHTYWLVKGPLYYYRPPGVTTDFQWGVYQGQKAADSFFDSPHESYINGLTTFADIEEGRDANGNVCNDNNDPLDDGFVIHPGYTLTQALINRNRQVLEGFIQGVYSYSRSGFSDFIPGLYTNYSIWQQWFGGARYYQQWFGGVDYQTPQPFVLWLAGGNNGILPCITCGPCSDTCSASDTQSQAINKFQSIRSTRFGNVGTVIWQYYIKAYTGSPSCPEACGDWDIATQNGDFKFYPQSNWVYLPTIMNDGSGGGGMSAGAMSGYPAPLSGTSSSDGSSISPDVDNSYPAPDK